MMWHPRKALRTRPLGVLAEDGGRRSFESEDHDPSASPDHAANRIVSAPRRGKAVQRNPEQPRPVETMLTTELGGRPCLFPLQIYLNLA